MAWWLSEFTHDQDPQKGFSEPSLPDSGHSSTTEFHIATADYTDPWSIIPSVANLHMYQNPVPISSQPSSPNSIPTYLEQRSPPPLHPNSSTLSNPSLHPVSSNLLSPSFRPVSSLLSNANRGPPTGDRTATRQRRVQEKCFHSCPWREKEKAQGAKEFSCRGCLVETLGEVRRHAERAHHVSFIRLCPTCNRHFLDRDTFQAEHGNDGRKCGEPRKQARGATATQAQWWELYHMIDVRVPTQVADSVSDVAISNSVDTATIIPSSREDPGTLQSYTTREQIHNSYDDVFHGISSTSPNLPIDPGANSKYVSDFDEQLREATSACELGPDVPHASAPIRPQHAITLHSSNCAPYIVHQDAPMNNSTVSRSPLPQRGSGKADRPNERQVETTTMSENNTQSSLQPLSAPKYATEQSSDTSRTTCIECGKSFVGDYAVGNLARHIRMKHGGTEYACKVEDCGEVFQRSDYRLKHYRNKHPELDVASARRRAT